MLNTPFSPWPNYSEEEVEAVSRVLRSNQVNYWTGGEAREFECEFAGFADCDHAIAVANGTLALDLALRFLVEPGDEVIVTPRTFIASVSSVVNARARPVFADVDADSQNITAESIEQVLTPRTRAIVVVHLAGQPADMDPIMDLAKRNDLKVIEDCAQAHGARYKGRSVGSMGHVGAWSFCQDKIMTTAGEGGMVTTNDATLWEKMWAFKDHGKSWDAVYNREHPSGYRWLHESFGTNWRMTEIQACIGRIQLKRMGSWQKKRFANASRIWNVCRGIDWLRVPPLDGNVTHAAYKAYVFVRKDRLPAGWDRDAILQEFSANNIPVFSGSCSEVYLEKAFDTSGFRPSKPLPVARELGETSLMFLCHPTLSDSEMVQTSNAIHAVDSRIKREIVA